MYSSAYRRHSMVYPRRRAPSTRNPTRTAKVKRWDGFARMTSEWDGLRRDMELWFPEGDCLVHLYAKGQSRRGPSFCIPIAALEQAQCDALTSFCQLDRIPTDAISARSSIYGHFEQRAQDVHFELYIPAPEDCSRDESFRWHIATRNFFAFLFGRPLVGAHLGQSLADLHDRLSQYRTLDVNNEDDVLTYFEDMGYLELGNNPDYALAMLYYAEQFQIEDLYIDAFAHCVGMNDQLCLSEEFAPINQVSKALITRAYLEMDLKFGRAIRALPNFLEDELSPAHLGLSQGARQHLERFRSFLHGFYVEKYGYWPPPRGSGFSKDMYRSMYFDFRSLYDYLVDLDSTGSLLDQKPASGGICVLQNVQAFDTRLKLKSLPNPMPRLPMVQEPPYKTQSQRSLVSLKMSTKQTKIEKNLMIRAALMEATNVHNMSFMTSSLVREYRRFERDSATKPNEKVSVADGRKVRWILIYATLQMLVSVTGAPPEVRDTETVRYPLCCGTAGLPPWTMPSKIKTSIDSSSVVSSPSTVVHAADEDLPSDRPVSSISIHPDCEFNDYFSHKAPASNDGSHLNVDMPAPLRINNHSSLLRKASLRSFKAMSFTSLSRRSSVHTKLPQPFCEILVQQQSHDMDAALASPKATQEQAAEMHELPSHHLQKSKSFSNETDRAQRRATLQLGPLPNHTARSRTPILEPSQLDFIHDPPLSSPASSSAASSDGSPSSNAAWSSADESTASDSSATSADSQYGSDDESCHQVLRRSSSVYSTDGGPLGTRPEEQPSFDFQLASSAEEDKGILVNRSFSVESVQVANNNNEEDKDEKEEQEQEQTDIKEIPTTPSESSLISQTQTPPPLSPAIPSKKYDSPLSLPYTSTSETPTAQTSTTTTTTTTTANLSSKRSFSLVPDSLRRKIASSLKKSPVLPTTTTTQIQTKIHILPPPPSAARPAASDNVVGNAKSMDIFSALQMGPPPFMKKR